MIINDRKDLDAAADDVRDRFLASLAGSINKYAWDGTEWVLEQNTTEIERFGFTIDDFPDSPVPDTPDYNPEERALEQARESASLSRANFKLALMEAGYLQEVKDFVANTNDERIQILWEDSDTFARLNPDLLNMASQMGYTDEQMDALFGVV